jgi:hypothetical protein
MTQEPATCSPLKNGHPLGDPESFHQRHRCTTSPGPSSTRSSFGPTDEPVPPGGGSSKPSSASGAPPRPGDDDFGPFYAIRAVVIFWALVGAGVLAVYLVLAIRAFTIHQP